MPIFTNVQGTWKSVAPHGRKGTTWKDTNAFIKVNGVWKPSFSFVPTFVEAPVIAVKNVKNLYAQVAVRMPETGVHRSDIRRIRITAKIGGTGYSSGPEVGVYKQPNKAGGTEWWSDVWYNDQGVGTNGKTIHDGRTTGNWVYKQFPPTYKKGHKLKPSTRYAFEAWAQHMDGTWSSGAFQFTNTNKKGSNNLSDYNKYYTYMTVFYPKRVGTMDIATKVFTEGRAISGNGTLAWFDYGPQIRGLIANTANLDFWNELKISRAKNDGGQPSARIYAGRTGSFSTDLFREPVFMTNHGSDTAEARISQGERKKIQLPKKWRDNIAKFNSWEGFAVMLYPSDRLNTYAEYNSAEEDPYQGALYMRWML